MKGPNAPLYPRYGIPGRKAALESARKHAGVLKALTGITALGVFVPSGYLPVAALMMVLPWAAIALAVRSPGLYTLDDTRGDARAGVGVALVLPGLILVLHSLRCYQLLNWMPLLAAAAAIALGMTCLAAYADQRLVQKKTVFLLLPIMVAYGYGSLVTVDALLDSSPPRVFETTVIDKHYTGGKGSHPELKIAPWGPDPGGDTSASAALYESVDSGSVVCVYLRPGMLGAPWYHVDHCPP